MEGEDGVLRLDEVYNLRLNADLVVLSACETGLGPVIQGEGILSLTRGFLYAGASNVLVSLWKAADAQTGELMPSFYGYMLDGTGKSAALRWAKLAMIRSNPRYARPFYWAPFVLVGA
jgi:CHAT domain-containing protein